MHERKSIARRHHERQGASRSGRAGASRHVLLGGRCDGAAQVLLAVAVAAAVAGPVMAQGKAATPAAPAPTAAPATAPAKPQAGADKPLVPISTPTPGGARAAAPSATIPAKPPAETAGTAPAAAAKTAPPAAAVAATAEKKAPDTPERRFMHRMDELLAPARDHAVSVETATRLRDGFKAISGRDAAGGKRILAELQDPLARKLLEWHLLRSGFGEPSEYMAFLKANPQWPDRSQIVQRMEDAAFVQGGSARDIKAFFKAHEPRTGVGLAALASAHLADGETDRARALATKAWREYDIPSLLELAFLERFGRLLVDADHRRRFDRITIDDPRWTNDRNDKAVLARRVMARMSEPERTKAEARLAVLLRAPAAQQLMDALPQDKDDLGLVYHRAQLMRRSGRIDEARSLLAAAHAAPQLLVSPDEWWEERRLVAYELLKAGHAKSAYELVRLPAPLSVNPLKDQTFMAGWLASRYLADFKAAFEQFTLMRKAADGPLSRAKSDYWLARTATALKDEALTERHYRSSAENFDTFYGQLSRQLLDRKASGIKVVPPEMPSAAEAESFVNGDATRAVVVARKAGLDLTVTRAFLNHFRNTLKAEGEMAMAAHLADALGDTQMAVRIGKHAIARGQNLVYYAYPLHAFPRYQPLRPAPETAMLLAIARQESEFNPGTVSGAGARGLLQVMPVTARHVCRDYKLKCELDKLNSDSSYNAKLASAYIGDRMQEFQGSYVLAIAGYNAGPGRARQWVREFGDPRDAKVDPVDWINRIPFEETREYVQKVMSNIQIYRARLGEETTALRLIQDLARARGGGEGASSAKQKSAAEN